MLECVCLMPYFNLYSVTGEFKPLFTGFQSAYVPFL